MQKRTPVHHWGSLLSGTLDLQIAHGHDTIVQTAVFDQLLAVSGHDALVRREGVRIDDSRGAEQRDVRSVEVTRIQNRVALEAEQDLAVREERVLVQLDLALDRTGRGDADINPVLGQSV